MGELRANPRGADDRMIGAQLDARARSDPQLVFARPGGWPLSVRRAFRERFGIPIHDPHCMTQASRFATQNGDGAVGEDAIPRSMEGGFDLEASGYRTGRH